MSAVGLMNHSCIGVHITGLILRQNTFYIVLAQFAGGNIHRKNDGAIIGSFFPWELFKKGFALYLSHSGGSNKAYGAMGGAFLLITWIYYSCTVLLIGPILCKMYHEHCEEGGVTAMLFPLLQLFLI